MHFEKKKKIILAYSNLKKNKTVFFPTSMLFWQSLPPKHLFTYINLIVMVFNFLKRLDQIEGFTFLEF